MARISRRVRKWMILFIWTVGLSLAAGIGLWNYKAAEKDIDNRLIGDAARVAGELAGLLSIQGKMPNVEFANLLINGALEDERVYAVKITAEGRMLDGIRRNYLWEPVPWDDEIAENSIQGLNPLKILGKPVGRVEVWLATRSSQEEKSVFLSREIWRFICFFILWTSVLLLLLWHWGYLKAFTSHFQGKMETSQDNAEKIILGLCAKEKNMTTEVDNINPVSVRAGRKYQRVDPEAWYVTAGLFRQTFARAPELMSRLYADGEIAGLCHLGRTLEQAAPCVGAVRLLETAKEMQQALNNPDSDSDALAVDECVSALEEVLNVLCGKKPVEALEIENQTEKPADLLLNKKLAAF